MKNISLFILLFLFILPSCQNNIPTEELRKEILNTEKEFVEMVKEEGVAKAFESFAAEDAVLNRNDTLIVGKEDIKEYFKNQVLTDVELEWTPDFVDVSASGDMAYTYGNYSFTAKDTSGRAIKGRGVFHNVWKKQEDGSWKFVWD